MKNKSVIIGIVFYVAIIFLSLYFIVVPSVKKLSELSKIKELTVEEKTVLIDEINKKYSEKEIEINEKYLELEKSVNDKYTPMIENIKTEYDNKEEEIKDKYKKLEKEYDSIIDKKKAEQTNEFFKNGLSEKYNNMSSEIMSLSKEKGQLTFDKSDEIRDLEKKKQEELDRINKSKSEELNTINKNKSDELKRFNESKENEVNEINNRNKTNEYLKSKSILYIIIGFVIILLPLLYIIIVFNKLTKLYNNVKEKWSSVDVLLKQRADLIPNIVECVKEYSKYEKDTLVNVTKARNEVLNAASKEEEINANEHLGNVVDRLFALKEDYPELKSNSNFMILQDNLRDLENNISIRRSEYNKSVLNYKNKIETFPSNIIANIFKFKEELFFEIDKEEKENLKVNLS